MLVCHCRAVNDRRIHAEIDRGARCDVDVALACGAGAECGGCLPAVNRLLDERLGCSLRARAAEGGAVVLPTATVTLDVGATAAVG